MSGFQEHKKRTMKTNGASRNTRGSSKGMEKRHEEVVCKHSNSSSSPPQISGIYSNARFVHAAAALVGHVVQIRVRGGSVYEGVFNTLSPNLEVALESVHEVDGEAPTEGATLLGPCHLTGLLKCMDKIRESKEQPLKDFMVFKLADIVTMTAHNIDLDYATKENNFTDTAISRYNGVCGEKKLQKWMDDDDDLADGEIEDGGLDSLATPLGGHGDGKASAAWDPEEMFKLNQEKFGVETTYQDNLNGYTFQLENRDDEEFRFREAEAARIANEIESNPNYKKRAEMENGGEGDDEEQKFSAVVREGRQDRTNDKYVPPNVRGQRATPPNQGPMNGAKGGPTGKIKTSGHHSAQRGTHSGHHRSSPVGHHSGPPTPSGPSPSQRTSKEDKRGDRSPASASPKPEKRDSPYHNEGQRSPILQSKDERKTVSPIGDVVPSSPTPSTTPNPPTANTDEMVKKSTLNPNAKEFVFTLPKAPPPATPPKLPPPAPSPSAQTQHHSGGGGGGQRMTPGPPHASSTPIMLPHMQAGVGGGPLIMTSPHMAFQSFQSHHNQQAQQGNRQYRGNKGNTRHSSEHNIHVAAATGPPLLAGPPQHQNVVLGYSGPPPTYGGGPPPGVPPGVVAVPPHSVQGQQVHMQVPYSHHPLMQARGVMSPPAGAIHISGPGHPPQMYLREIQPSQFIPTYDAALQGVSVASQPPRLPYGQNLTFVAVPQHQSSGGGGGAPTPPSQGNHGPGSGPPIMYQAPQWATQPIMVMGPVGGSGGPAGTPPPHMNMIIAATQMGPPHFPNQPPPPPPVSMNTPSQTPTGQGQNMPPMQQQQSQQQPGV